MMLQEVLHTSGVSFTDSLADADILIRMKADTRKGTTLSGLYSAFLDITVSVKDISADREIYGDHLTNIKGIKLSFEDAVWKPIALPKINSKINWLKTDTNYY